MNLDDRERSCIVRKAEAAFCRMPFALPSPFKSRQQAADYWYDQYEPSVVNAFYHLERNRAPLAPMCQLSYWIASDDYEALINLGTLPPEGPTRVGILGPHTDKIAVRHPAFLRAQVSMGEWEAWTKAYGEFDEQIVRSRYTLASIVRMASTVGQLARMVPELVACMSPDGQAIAATQERASRLPAAWASFEQQSVFAMVHCLARCFMFPAVPDGTPINYLALRTTSVRLKVTKEIMASMTPPVVNRRSREKWMI